MKDLVLRELKNAKNHELFYVESEVNEAHLEKNKLNFASKVFDSGYGIRILDGGLGFSSSNVKSPEVVRKVIDNATKGAKMTEKVNFHFPSQKNYNHVDVIDKRIKSGAEQAIAEFSEKVLAEKPDDIDFSFGKFRTYDSKIHIINSEGLDLEREETAFMLELSMVTERGKKVEFWMHDFRRRLEDFTREDFEKWFKLSREQLDAKVPDTGEMAVILSPTSVLDGLGPVVSFHTSGMAKVNEMSKFSLNEKVGVDGLTIHSDGLYPFGLMSSGFDDEGIPQQKITLIDRGIFKKFTYNQFFALKDNAESTGNGLRQGDVFYVFDAKFGSLPANQISNFCVEPGKKSLEEMIGETKNGILVEKFSWLNPDGVTGDFSAEISSGYRIKNGEIANPIKGGLVAGNIIELLGKISGISDRSVITSGGTMFAGVCPYVGFKDVQVAGT
jgi:PmbA protein